VSDPQSEWAEALLGSLYDAGVRDVIISPGSRSTPLVWAACQVAGLRRHALIDERSAGFYALGQARLTGVPSLLICTSGTAPSHYYPAVIEARESGTPLIVLSADRPFELQHKGAHQTIDQTRLFGAYAQYFELGTPVGERQALLGLCQHAWHAVAASLDAPRGAVHLNFRAKKPLEPPREPTRSEPQREPDRVSQRLTRRPPTEWRRSRGVADADVIALTHALHESTCPLLVCGALSPADSPDPALVERFAALSGVNVCAESVSQLRFRLDPQRESGAVCDAYDWLLGNRSFGTQARPDFALQIGAAPLSASLGRLIEGSADTFSYAICAESGWPDSQHQAARIVRGRPSELLAALCDALTALPPRLPRPAVQLWRDGARRARVVVSRELETQFGEPEAVLTIWQALPEDSILVVGNSLPPRLLDRYCPAAARGLRVLSQRGASGIDGGVAGALGAASVADAPTTLLLGDISFLHDVGSLWAARAEQRRGAPFAHPAVLVVLNNGGGRIFEQLPVAGHPRLDQGFWTTPHTAQLRGAAELYGLPFESVCERPALRRALDAAYARGGVTLIEVVVDPHSAAERLVQIAAVLERDLGELLASP
jgi:2-succinyl-5-enolpyruvyl-6-hydroxy-3-cyclohexene-1-carboxylate synthase